MTSIFSELSKLALLCVMTVSMVNVQSQPIAEAPKDSTAPQIHLIYFGGPDCPPCVAWRQDELPKLEKTEAFKAIKFSYVRKTVGSSIPSSFFLPDEVKPYKDKLYYASSGRGGSPQAALMVNGEVYHYLVNVRTAEQYERMILAAQNGTEFPGGRCTRRGKDRECVEAVKP